MRTLRQRRKHHRQSLICSYSRRMSPRSFPSRDRRSPLTRARSPTSTVEYIPGVRRFQDRTRIASRWRPLWTVERW